MLCEMGVFDDGEEINGNNRTEAHGPKLRPPSQCWFRDWSFNSLFTNDIHWNSSCKNTVRRTVKCFIGSYCSLIRVSKDYSNIVYTGWIAYWLKLYSNFTVEIRFKKDVTLPRVNLWKVEINKFPSVSSLICVFFKRDISYTCSYP